MSDPEHQRGEFTLRQTCFACPEQYDVYLNGARVGYLRLRHGYFYAECPVDSEPVYTAHPRGDGIFEPDERDYHLDKAVAAIRAKITGQADDFIDRDLYIDAIENISLDWQRPRLSQLETSELVKLYDRLKGRG